MKTGEFDPGRPEYWPSAPQRLLIEAALADGDEAIRAWRAWRADHTLERADHASVFVLPAVYANLLSAGYDGPDALALKGVYRYAWGKAQLTCRRAAEVSGRLADGGVESIVLKGVALAQTTYADVGLRMMYDMDFLIREASLERALELLAEDGWSGVVPPRSLRFALNEIELRRRDRPPLDLHYRDYPTGSPPDAVDELWARRRPARWAGTLVHVPDATDAMLHCLIDGRKLDPQARCRWVLDAAHVIGNRAEEVDWSDLPRRAQAVGMRLPVADALDYLRDEVGLPVPSEPVGALRRAATTTDERERYMRSNRVVRAGRRRGVRERLQLRWERYEAALAWGGRTANPARFVTYVVDFYAWRLRVLAAGALRARPGRRHRSQRPHAVGASSPK